MPATAVSRADAGAKPKRRKRRLIELPDASGCEHTVQGEARQIMIRLAGELRQQERPAYELPFLLAQRLRKFEADVAGPADFAEVVTEFCELTGIDPEDYGVSKFMGAWKNVEYVGPGPFAEAVEAALGDVGRLRFAPAIPACFEKYAAVCYRLHLNSGGEPFALPCRLLGGALGVSFSSAASHIAALVTLGVIEKTKAHKLRVTAAEYRFTATVTDASGEVL